MDIAQITQYLIELSPAITALVGIVVTIVVGVKKIKAANAETIADVKATNKHMKEANIQLMKENAELKGEIKKVLNELHNVKEK